MIYGYIRISKDTSDTANQRADIERHAATSGQNVTYIEETVSGKVDADKRKLGALIEKLTAADTLIVSDVSRLGRNTLDVAGVGSQVVRKKARLIFAREDWELKDLSGSGIDW